MDPELAHVTVTEQPASRRLAKGPDDCSCRQLFAATGALNGLEAEAAVRLQPVPEEVDWARSRITIESDPVFFDRLHPDLNIFEVSRTYTRRTADEDDDGIEWRLSMSTTTATCTTARRAVAAAGSRPFWEPPPEPSAPGAPVEPEGAGSPINVRRVNGKDETGGVEIAVPSFKLTLGFECSAKKWKKLRPILLRVPRGAVNADPFQDFAPGELLFSGFESQRISNGEAYRLNYSFDISVNEDFTAGPFTIPDAPGWSAKWSYWGSEEEVELLDGTTAIRPKCDGAYASEVHGRMTFADLLPSAIADELEG